MGMTITPNDNELLVTLYDQEAIAVVDLSTNTKSRNINLNVDTISSELSKMAVLLKNKLQKK